MTIFDNGASYDNLPPNLVALIDTAAKHYRAWLTAAEATINDTLEQSGPGVAADVVWATVQQGLVEAAVQLLVHHDVRPFPLRRTPLTRATGDGTAYTNAVISANFCAASLAVLSQVHRHRSALGEDPSPHVVEAFRVGCREWPHLLGQIMADPRADGALRDAATVLYAGALKDGMNRTILLGRRNVAASLDLAGRLYRVSEAVAVAAPEAWAKVEPEDRSLLAVRNAVSSVIERDAPKLNVAYRAATGLPASLDVLGDAVARTAADELLDRLVFEEEVAQSLTYRERQVFDAVFRQDLPYEAVASDLGMRPGTVKSTVSHIKTKMKSALTCDGALRKTRPKTRAESVNLGRSILPICDEVKKCTS